MKKIISLLMLVMSITGMIFAQEKTTKSDKTFELPANHARRIFLIDLGKGNKMQMELSNLEDLKLFSNMDSVITVFMKDLEPLKDSLGDELLSRRIDYTTDTLGRKKIRIQQFKPKGSSFIVQDGDVAALKLEQDTVNFIGKVSFIAKYTLRKAFTSVRSYRVSFFLNNLSDLASYTDGRLNEKIRVLLNNVNTSWVKTSPAKGSTYLKEDPSITAKYAMGFVGGGNSLNFRISVDAQNYKNYFVPSFSLGTGFIISNGYFKRDIILSWDPNFFFSRDSLGKLRTFRNDFITLTWGQGLVKDNQPRKESHLLFIMSLGYLVKRDGNYFDKNTMRLGAGRLSLFEGKTKIEPVLYFHKLFKDVTPSLRWIQSF